MTKIDRLGRVLIPKAVRDRLRLDPGRRLRIEEEGGSVRLVLVEEDVDLGERDGLPVLTGDATSSMADAVEEHRRARIRSLGGT